MADLLDGFTFGPTTINDSVVDDHFAQHFWGEKNLGFSVLYHNMKHGQSGVKSLQDLIRESANTEDIYAKHLTKLAKQAASVPTVGSCAPIFEVIKTMAEKLSSCHGDIVLKLNDLIKDLGKYSEEQKGKHKQVKDQLSGTADALSSIQSTSASVKRSRDKYHQLCLDAERLRKSAATAKDVERAENKSKRAEDEYRGLVDKYETARGEFESKMTESAKRFQDLEEAHLRHMKSVFESYVLSHENASVLINQVHQEFRRQLRQHTVDSLIKQYSESKGTGTEKPGAIEFEECDLSAVVLPAEAPNVNGAASEDNVSHTTSKTSKMPIGLPFRRKRGNARKSQKDGNNGGSNKGTDRDAESIESPDKDSSVKIDEEGYTIRPETPKSTKNSWGFDSSDSDFSDDGLSKKIHVKINPKDEVVGEPGGSDLDTLNAVTRNLTLNSPSAIGGKRVSRHRPGAQQKDSTLEIMPRTRRTTSSDAPGTQDRGAADLNSTTERISSGGSETVPPVSPVTPTRRTDPNKQPFPLAVKVLPDPPGHSEPTGLPSPAKPPVPKPRMSMSDAAAGPPGPLIKQRALASFNRFSTVFVPYDSGAVDVDTPPESADDECARPVARPRIKAVETVIDAGTPLGSSQDSLDSISAQDSPESRSSVLSAKLTPSKTKYMTRNTASNVTLRSFVQSPAASPTIVDPAQDSRSDHGSDVRRLSSASWVNFDDEVEQRCTRSAPNSTNHGPSKGRQSTSDKTEKSFSDELLDLFGNTSTVPSLKPAAPAFSGGINNDFSSLFGSKPDSPATAAKRSHVASPLPQSSSNVSLNNLLIESSDKEVEAVTNKQPSPLLPPPRSSTSGSDQKSVPARPTDLILSNSRSQLQKGSSAQSAPLASSESWSSLSPLSGTPLDSFASSRGPSPLTLTHGDSIPIAVAFTETVNAYFKRSTENRCMVKIVGEVQMSFPAGIVRAFTSNPNPPVLSFKIQGASVKDYTPNPDLLHADSSQTSSAHPSFWFNMPALTAYVKKMTDTNPNAPYYNIQVLSYQVSSASGHDLVPLHVSSTWTCEADFTDVRINYKYNSKCTSASLKSVQVLVPVNGVVTNVQCTPEAQWNAVQNRLSWKLSSPITNLSGPGELQSKLSLSSGPSKPATLAVQFMSEGSTLTGADFELSGTGYRVSLVKRRFATGKYLCDAS